MPVETFPAPSKGWVQNGNIILASKDQAERLDNFIPTAQGARLRGGATSYADIGAAVVRLFTYRSGTTVDLLAATADSIFDADRIAGGGSNTWAELEGLASGDWSAEQISTTGGQFTIAVNGSDHMVYWDGTNFEPVTTVAVNDLGFDAETTGFTVGETVTGGTSGASATVLAIVKDSATSGTLKLGTITAGPFQDNEALTGSSTGAATADGASAAVSTITLTGVATAALSQVWLFKERLFFVEKNTSSAWYLPVESIGGAATELDLGSVFSKGGSLLFGARWSLDSGSGLDDVCVFVSTVGEIAVYEGTDPASANTWSLVGVYQIGTPLNKHAFFAAGGDLAILTDDGIVSVADALRLDRAALQASAMTFLIEDAWKAAVADSTTAYPINATLWQAGTLLLVGTPDQYEGTNVSFVANARTGAWARITGWDVRCGAVAGDQLYFANNAGKVLKADTGGQDDGSQFSGTYVPKFTMGPTWMSANAVGITYRANAELNISLSAHSDYQIDDLTPPGTSIVASGTTWGTGVWGTFIWRSASDKNSYTEWQAAYDNGYSLAPSVQITSNQTSKLVFDILATRIRFELGADL